MSFRIIFRENKKIIILNPDVCYINKQPYQTKAIADVTDHNNRWKKSDLCPLFQHNTLLCKQNVGLHQARSRISTMGGLILSEEGLHVWFCTLDGQIRMADEGITVSVEA